jgi:hypothetical protein
MLEEYFYMPSSSNVTLSSSILYDTNSPIIVEETILTPTVQPNQSLYPVINVIDTNLYPKVTTVVNPFTSPFTNPFTNPYNNQIPSNYLYYDTGVGDTPLARHETNEYLRYKFLDNALIEDYPEILDMLKISDGVVKPASKSDSSKSDSENDVKKKIDFIGTEILTKSKNMKILKQIIKKNYNLRLYNLADNLDLVSSTQAKYVKKKIREMRN